MTEPTDVPRHTLAATKPDRLRGLVDQWEVDQWRSPQAIAARQDQHLAALLEHAWRQVPYYRRRLATAGYHPGMPVTPEIWQALPILQRGEVQTAGPALQADALPPGHGSSTPVTTSGSTGQPVTVTKSGLAQLVWSAITLREHRWHRRDFSRKLAAIRLFTDEQARSPAGRLTNSWGPPVSLVHHTGPAALLDVHVGLERQLDWLLEQRPAYLLSLPSNLLGLAKLSLARGISLPGLREARCVGEPVGEVLRTACANAWGIPVTDMYSTQELGYLALQCPGHWHYHVQSESVRIEILSPDGSPCRPGEVGLVVATPFFNFATPLLRYAPGDYAEVGEPCACGRGLAVLRRVLGRERNMWSRPNGDRWWPHVGSTSMAEFASIRQWQFVQKTVDTLEVRLVAPAPLLESEEIALRALVKARLGDYFSVHLSYYEDIPRARSGKFEDFVSDIP